MARLEKLQARRLGLGEAAQGPEEGRKLTYQDTGVVPTPEMSEAYRRNALGSMSEQEFARNKERMNASDSEYWEEQVRTHPDSIYANMAARMASDETPAEKRKRERRERLGQVFSNLGSVIGSAANLAYTAKGAYPIDLESPVREENARMRRIRDKREALQEKEDAILRDAKLKDLAGARQLAAARSARAAEGERFAANLALKREELAARAAQNAAENARKDRELDALMKDREARNAETARHNREIEKYYGRKGKEKQRYPVMQLEGNDGQRSHEMFDLNKDADVLKMYARGMRLGIFPDVTASFDDLGNPTADLKNLDVDRIRNYILSREGVFSKVADQKAAAETFRVGLGWGNEKDNDNQPEW